MGINGTAVAAALRMEKQIGRSCVKILSKHVVRPHIRPSALDTQRAALVSAVLKSARVCSVSKTTSRPPVYTLEEESSSENSPPDLAEHVAASTHLEKVFQG